ncbi:hypothetical protein [Anatilimnocola floriformis]|uniref:hypothetical protein n=1 Tax=Anatilimnocola floriformis TaxID=2948575 RepID=UPI0020C40662|nr:hypothetical protein [Anatilimnocola floriformis]
MNIDHVLQTFNDCGVRYMLIGGMNFALRHQPYTTYDIDLWIEDSDENVVACDTALAKWGRTDSEWDLTRNLPPNWLRTQGVFSLHSPHGAIDIFRAVKGLGEWEDSFGRSIQEKTNSGSVYQGLGDDDMIRCQLALDASHRKVDRVRVIQAKLQNKGNENDA